MHFIVICGLKHNKTIHLHNAYAPINVKPEEGGGGSGNTREFDCDAYPQGGDFDLTSCIWSVNFNE